MANSRFDSASGKPTPRLATWNAPGSAFRKRRGSYGTPDAVSIQLLWGRAPSPVQAERSSAAACGHYNVGFAIKCLGGNGKFQPAASYFSKFRESGTSP